MVKKAIRTPPVEDMYDIWILLGALLVLALLLVHYKPGTGVAEGFATAAVDPTRMVACAERSYAAQSLLARFSDRPTSDDNAEELRLLISKLCCIEADVSAPVPGLLRTHSLQYRTAQDTEAPASIVSRCVRNALQTRDIEIIVEKYEARGHELIDGLLGPCQEAHGELTEIVTKTRTSMMTFCTKPQPQMDRPSGVRDPGYWETDTVAELSQYQGISAEPK
jgi:hypothetical protein